MAREFGPQNIEALQKYSEKLRGGLEKINSLINKPGSKSWPVGLRLEGAEAEKLPDEEYLKIAARVGRSVLVFRATTLPKLDKEGDEVSNRIANLQHHAIIIKDFAQQGVNFPEQVSGRVQKILSGLQEELPATPAENETSGTPTENPQGMLVVPEGYNSIPRKEFYTDFDLAIIFGRQDNIKAVKQRMHRIREILRKTKGKPLGPGKGYRSYPISEEELLELIETDLTRPKKPRRDHSQPHQPTSPLLAANPDKASTTEKLQKDPIILVEQDGSIFFDGRKIPVRGEQKKILLELARAENQRLTGRQLAQRYIDDGVDPASVLCRVRTHISTLRTNLRGSGLSIPPNRHDPKKDQPYILTRQPKLSEVATGQNIPEDKFLIPPDGVPDQSNSLDPTLAGDLNVKPEKTRQDSKPLTNGNGNQEKETRPEEEELGVNLTAIVLEHLAFKKMPELNPDLNELLKQACSDKKFLRETMGDVEAEVLFADLFRSTVERLWGKEREEVSTITERKILLYCRILGSEDPNEKVSNSNRQNSIDAVLQHFSITTRQEEQRIA